MVEFQTLVSSSKGNCYILSDSRTKIMIECGIPIAKIKQKGGYRLHEIQACLVSHGHLDHSAAAKDIMSAGIDLYTGEATIEALGLTGHRIHTIKPFEQFRIGTLAIKALPVPHDVENLAFLIASGKEKFFFLVDCAYCPYLFQGLTGIAIGVNYQAKILKQNIKSGYINPSLGRRIMQNHMSLATALQFFEDQDISTVREIHILHISETNADKEVARRTVQKATGKLVLIT